MTSQQPRLTTPTAHGRFEDQPWADRALCAQTDPEMFFPDKGGSTREAKRICNGDPDKGIAPCPVREQCLDWALATEQRFGIFGGTSERERRRLKKTQPDLVEQPTLAATGTDDTRPAPRSYGGAYIGGVNGSQAHIPVPTAPSKRFADAPPARKQTGLDWSKHTAPEPEKPAAPATLRCRWCRQPADDLVDDLCGACRADAEAKFTTPTPATPASLDLVGGVNATPTAAQDDGDGTKDAPEVVHLSTTGDDRTTTRATTPVPVSCAPDHTTLDVVDQCGQLLRTTAADDRPAVQALRGSILAALAALDLLVNPETPVAASAPQASVHPAVERSPDAATGFQVFDRPRKRRRTSHVDTTKIIRLYIYQRMTIADIANQLGHGKQTVRNTLIHAGVQLRDDRKTNSGGHNRVKYAEQLVTDVRRLYLEEQLTQSEVGRRLGVSTKVVQNVMARHDIPARPSAAAKSKAGVGRSIKLNDEQRAAICRRYQDGESTGFLARDYGVSAPSIIHVLERAGIPRRTKAETAALRVARTTITNQSGVTA